MNKTKKRVLIVLLSCASVGVWVPQLLGLGHEDAPPVRPDLPAVFDASGAPAAALAAPQASPAGAASVNPPAGAGAVAESASAPAAGSTPPTPADTTQMLAALQRGLDRLEQSTTRAKAASLDELSQSWAERESATQPPTTTTSTPVPASELPGTSFDPAPLESFLEAHPLRLVLIGEHERVARLGSLEVREGERLLHGVRVARIASNGLTLETPAGEVQVELARFEARPRSHDPVRAPESAAPAPAPAAPAPAPAAPVAPATANPNAAPKNV